MKNLFLNLFKQKNILKEGETMENEKRFEAIEKLLKSYDMLNSALENRVRILEYQIRKLKEDLATSKKDNNLKSD